MVWRGVAGGMSSIRRSSVAVDMGAAGWHITAAPLAVSIKAETAPPCKTPVAGSPTSRASHGMVMVARPCPSSVNCIPSAWAWGMASMNCRAMCRMSVMAAIIARLAADARGRALFLRPCGATLRLAAAEDLTWLMLADRQLADLERQQAELATTIADLRALRATAVAEIARES